MRFNPSKIDIMVNMPISKQVQLLAAKAAVAFLVAEDLEPNALNHFKDLLPFILNVGAII